MPELGQPDAPTQPRDLRPRRADPARSSGSSSSTCSSSSPPRDPVTRHGQRRFASTSSHSRALLVLTVVVGVLYPLVITGVAQAVFHRPGQRIDWSSCNGTVVGSSLIGQNFTDAKGNPLRKYFQSRPSAAGKDGYDPTSTGASNLGPNNTDLVKAINERRAADRRLRRRAPGERPGGRGDGVGLGSRPAHQPGLRLRAGEPGCRGPSPGRPRSCGPGRRLMQQGRVLGFLGEPRVNVLQLNLALDRLPTESLTATS